jgi:hypothetical protein
MKGWEIGLIVEDEKGERGEWTIGIPGSLSRLTEDEAIATAFKFLVDDEYEGSTKVKLVESSTAILILVD